MSGARVYVVDDDEAVRLGLRLLLASAGLPARLFGSALEFLAEYDPVQPGCLLLDVRMPGLSGTQLQERLKQRDIALPVIVLTGHADVSTAVRAMKHGAFDFIEKPFNDQLLLDRVQQALELDAERRRARREAEAAQALLQRLTAREREVLELLVSGCANKVIAMELGISERTVELHRANVLRKMQVRSTAQLAQQTLLARTARD